MQCRSLALSTRASCTSSLFIFHIVMNATSNWLVAWLLLLLGGLRLGAAAAVPPHRPPSPSILVLGSVNMDITVDVARLPLKGETTTSRTPSVSLAVGGKGGNQAVAAARLALPSNATHAPPKAAVRFICRFGNDSYAEMLQQELADAGVDISGCQHVGDLGSGQGIVMLEPDGAASSIVVGGANTAWGQGVVLPAAQLSGVGVVMLQREVPQAVNLAAAKAAAVAGATVLLDAGGTDQPLDSALLPFVSYLCPNELELQALTGSSTQTQAEVVAAARGLIKSGVSLVLVTLSERGAVLVLHNDTVITQPALPVPGDNVVDGTAAGDAFRAGFAVGLVQGWPLQHCLQFAAAAGSLAVSRKGALPSLPTLQEVTAHLQAHAGQVAPELLQALGPSTGTSTAPPDTAAAPAGPQSCSSTSSPASCVSTPSPNTAPQQPTVSDPSTLSTPATLSASEECPLRFGSRLNSMAARRDLVQGAAGAAAGGAGGTDGGGGAAAGAAAGLSNDVLGWIARQGQVGGLSTVDLNYPQHFNGLRLEQIKAALKRAGLSPGAVNIRFPERFLLGAFTNPDPTLRAAAVQLAVDGCSTAAQMGSDHLVVWSPYDGYDYYLQVYYDTAWQHTVDSFRQLVDACPASVRVSLEFKPTDPSTRFSIVSNTATALLLAYEVAHPRFGLTLDVGHMLLAGENPAASVALVARAGKLFGLHLNDAHIRLGAEDGLMFASVNPTMSLELVLQLQKAGYSGEVYFDTFPTHVDPVQEAAWNVRKFKSLWRKAARLSGQLSQLSRAHDALGVLQLLEDDPGKAPQQVHVMHDEL